VKLPSDCRACWCRRQVVHGLQDQVAVTERDAEAHEVQPSHSIKRVQRGETVGFQALRGGFGRIARGTHFLRDRQVILTNRRRIILNLARTAYHHHSFPLAEPCPFLVDCLLVFYSYNLPVPQKMFSACSLPQTTLECLSTNGLTTVDSFFGVTRPDLISLGIPFGDSNLILKTINDSTSAPAASANLPAGAASNWKFHNQAAVLDGLRRSKHCDLLHPLCVFEDRLLLKDPEYSLMRWTCTVCQKPFVFKQIEHLKQHAGGVYHLEAFYNAFLAVADDSFSQHKEKRDAFLAGTRQAGFAGHKRRRGEDAPIQNDLPLAPIQHDLPLIADQQSGSIVQEALPSVAAISGMSQLGGGRVVLKYRVAGLLVHHWGSFTGGHIPCLHTASVTCWPMPSFIFH
jgi:hypothetical protein